ncbi:MAG: hypothetical protein JSW67_14400 [Candidatus Latescibacterota bacterium]|nr:MAG: hypothetical protein JSW67_14400 [Candidatus Latescibacterota bacterium]
MADVDGESRSRARPGKRARQQLRDISHLYISTRRNQPVARRRVARQLRLGFVANGDRPAKADVCGNMAVQLARLGKRTLVLDLDPMLPNAGFHLGLEAAAYMAHLRPQAQPRVERGLLGLRVVEGIAARDERESLLPESMQRELSESDCVIVNLPTYDDGAVEALQRVGGALGRVDAPPAPGKMSERGTTMAEMGSRSRMFGDWLATARRAPGEEARETSPPPIDALLCVHAHGDGASARRVVSHFRDTLPLSHIHVVAWGDSGADLDPRPWARIRAYPRGLSPRQPLSSLYPEHPAARIYQNLVQALFAGLGGRGGPGA